MSSQPWEVPEELWVRLEPLFPKKPRRFRYPGRRPLDDRRVLSGILFVLAPGSAGSASQRARLRVGDDLLAAAAGLAGGRRVAAAARVAARRVAAAGEIDWSRAVVDASYIQAKRGSATGPSPVDRGRSGSKYHLLTDGSGLPLAWTLTGANRTTAPAVAAAEAIPPVRGKPGPPKRRPRRWSPTAATTRSSTAANSARSALHPDRARKPSTAPGSAAGAGSSSAPSPGSTSTTDSTSATNAANKPIKRCSTSPAA